jgi:YbbR domain-containing protein
MRPRSQTLGTLGRSPARVTKPPVAPPRPPVVPPTPPERGVLRRWLRSAMFDNLGLKFLSVVLAVTVFLLVSTDKDREMTVLVGVSYTLPEDKVLVSERIDDVRVTVKGSWRRLRKVDTHEIAPIHLDLRRATGGEIAISNDMIHLPSGVAITSINPRYVRIAFDKRGEKVVEVHPVVTGRPQHGYVADEPKPQPATVKLRGADTALAAVTSVPTREISLEGKAESLTAETEVQPPDGVEVAGNARISVQIRVDEQLVTRKVPGVSVALKGDGDPARWTVSPAQVDVTLIGALLAVEKARGTLVPVVKLTPDPKPREVEITVEGVPPGVGVKVSPEHAKLAPAKPPSPSPPAR